MPYTGPDGINMVEKWPNMTKVAISSSWEWPKNSGMSFPGNKSPCGSALVRRKLLETYPNQINSFKRDFKNWHFPKKWNLEGILPVKINFLPKIQMVRMVQMNTVGRMDLGKLEIKNQFWKKTDSHQSSEERGSKNWFPGDPKYLKSEFYGSSWMSGPSHSIRLVNLVSKNSTRAKVNRKFVPKFIFDPENQ